MLIEFGRKGTTFLSNSDIFWSIIYKNIWLPVDKQMFFYVVFLYTFMLACLLNQI